MTFKMTRMFPLAAILSLTATGAAFAHSDSDRGSRMGSCGGAGASMPGAGMMPSGMMEGGPMPMRMHGQMMGAGTMGPMQCAMMGAMDGRMMGMMGMMGRLDTDADGEVTGDEARAALSAKLTEYDKDGDGTLSIAEFEALHTAMICETMVDRFQYLDADGDGRVTSDEMTAPADQFERMERMRERMMDRRRGAMMPDGGMRPGTGMGSRNMPMQGDGGMMQDN